MQNSTHRGQGFTSWCPASSLGSGGGDPWTSIATEAGSLLGMLKEKLTDKPTGGDSGGSGAGPSGSAGPPSIPSGDHGPDKKPTKVAFEEKCLMLLKMVMKAGIPELASVASLSDAYDTLGALSKKRLNDDALSVLNKELDAGALGRTSKDTLIKIISEHLKDTVTSSEA